jgi:hypothetical protein
MSKKTFFTINWKEVLLLLLVDFFVLSFFIYSFVSECTSKIYSCMPNNPCPVNTQLSCTLEFLLDFQNMIFVFIIVLVINFGLSVLWHFVVRERVRKRKTK